MSTRCPNSFSLGSSRSSNSNLPEERQMAFSDWRVISSRCSRVKKRYGWLHTFLSCISTLFNPETLSSPLAPTVHSPWFCICRYNIFCSPVSSHFTTYSALSGSCASTSVFIRRSKNGRSAWCSRLITSKLSSSFIAKSSAHLSAPAAARGAENHCSNVSDELKILGRRKLSSAHSSCSEFCSGVPVSSTRRSASYCSSVALSLDAAFFIRCPSSMMMYLYRNRRSRCLSFITSS
mmetsp:Transcript_29864/g.74636  ORF Transcript_29864/g.74636 Transcript_29864/m.74636 type:complete len:235 (-) Transcript_29864:978-1682(-)